ncbi:Uncharacterised protein [Mycobacterium tuberculosis]|uniref:Uncharacterized protein n=1 Tax=Mycobacterium tuberculosis TaxID=1773 RepID=A0A916L897_MYCTX|nr:Uncharacterised protein [Mycobacterium tuberculosis]COX06447.1 Uncharacterised protein [Mycobacterium tuberculosis]COY04120.1 Uncharacterised protein [Mycobacterium tuberculosis]
MYPGSTVNLRWVFPSQHRHPHTPHRSAVTGRPAWRAEEEAEAAQHPSNGAKHLDGQPVRAVARGGFPLAVVCGGR